MTENAKGFFGPFGGQFVPEPLIAALNDVDAAFQACKTDEVFQAEFARLLQEVVGRPSPLYFAKRLTEQVGGAKIYLKREDLNHTGAHKINNTLAQAMLAKAMGKTHLIAETGAGQHGVATATAAALMGLECSIYQGAEDVRRQKLNVFRMELLGAKVVPVTIGQQTLSEAIDVAIGAWIEDLDRSFYLLGSVCGPHPYPEMVMYFQGIIGREARAQILEKEGRLPDLLIAAVGGGSNAGGLFKPMIDDADVKIIGVEAGGRGDDLGDNAAALTFGKEGVLHGAKSYVLQDEAGETVPPHSISAGLDYPAVGPEHAYWKDTGRVKYTTISDHEALDAFGLLCRTEGIIPALESAHAVAEAIRTAPTMGKDEIIIVNLSGRGDKDCAEVARLAEAGV
ncbi:MAG: tryptophan synthase subunit beta [Phycisphaerales bacterium]|jgi:tryptophan synthase beta chain|nr:tryptophan synthase subunit beta [Phycisphaerales bacterium]MBT7170752.1 tryptophan synthase subunit beta [Phycisphaerales bacterium]